MRNRRCACAPTRQSDKQAIVLVVQPLRRVRSFMCVPPTPLCRPTTPLLTSRRPPMPPPSRPLPDPSHAHLASRCDGVLHRLQQVPLPAALGVAQAGRVGRLTDQHVLWTRGGGGGGIGGSRGDDCVVACGSWGDVQAVACECMGEAGERGRGGKGGRATHGCNIATTPVAATNVTSAPSRVHAHTRRGMPATLRQCHVYAPAPA